MSQNHEACSVLNRREALTLALSGLAVASVPGRAVGGETLVSRTLVQLLHRAKHGSPPDLTGTVLSGLDLAGIDFKSAILNSADLFGATLSEANLAGARLAGARLDRAVITRTEFSSADLTGASLLGVTVFTELERNHRQAPRFGGARMAGAQLSGFYDYADFRWSDLTGAVFGQGGTQTSLFGARFGEAKLLNANLSGLPVTFGHFQGADLAGANLSKAELSQANFSGCNVSRMNVTGADLSEAIFEGVTGFETIIGLDSAKNRNRIKLG